MLNRPLAVCAMPRDVRRMVLSKESWEDLTRHYDVADTEGVPWEEWQADPRTTVLLTGWNSRPVTDELLASLPNLELIAHAGGSVRALLPDAVWRRGIRVSTAASVNNEFVAQFAFAHIVLCLKGAFAVARQGKEHRSWPVWPEVLGTQGRRIGLVSYGSVARHLRAWLRGLDVEVCAWDPFVAAAELEGDGVRAMPDLATLFAECSVVSLHAPLIEGETEGMITEELLRLLRPGSSFINTARGALVDQDALVRVLQDRPDVQAVLDVTWPDPPERHSPLWDLPNALLTGHVAGALGSETLALGQAAVDEAIRFATGQPLDGEVSAESARLRA